MRSRANRRSRLESRSWSMRSRTLGRASDAVMASPSHYLIVRGKTLRASCKFIAQALSLPRRLRILFVAAREQRCIFATLGHASTCPARQMASARWCILVTPRGMYIMNQPCRKCGEGVGAMDELVGWLVADLGVDRASRRKGGGDHFRLPGHGTIIRQSVLALGPARSSRRLAAASRQR